MRRSTGTKRLISKDDQSWTRWVPLVTLLLIIAMMVGAFLSVMRAAKVF